MPFNLRTERGMFHLYGPLQQACLGWESLRWHGSGVILPFLTLTLIEKSMPWVPTEGQRD